jgi:glucokinase
MILAADFGGTTIKLGLVHEGRVSARARLEVETHRTMPEQLEAVAGIWEELLRQESFPRRDCLGVSLALPFLVDANEPRVRGEFEKFPGATKIDFSAWSDQRLGLDVALENDLRLAILGEWSAGAARGKSDAVMLAFGTGIGCAVISSDRLFRGANNRAATLLGHSTVSLTDSAGRCGNIGCAEDLASTATMEQRARSRPDFPGSALVQAKKIDFETLFLLAAKGDACSQGLVQQSLHAWAVVVQNAVLAFDPEIVVLGGGVLRSRDVIVPAIQEHLRRYMPCFPLEIPVVAAELNDDAALLGGEVFFKQTQDRSRS